MASNERGTVSVAIPVYNGERYLAEALSSVTGQSVKPDETLVFDNCSTDRSREIAAGFVPEHAVRTAPKNLGAVVNFNRAVREASGEYFAWLAADDRLSHLFVERTLAALQATPQASACLPAIQFIDPGGLPVGEQRDPQLGSCEPTVRLRSFLRRPRWTEFYCLYRRSSLLASPMLTDAWGADVLLTWWFLLREPLLVLDEALYEYRTFPVKVADDVAAGLNPSMRGQQWRMMRLWLNLWQGTFDAQVERHVARTARRELISALVARHWLKHLVWDVYMFTQSLPGFGWIRRLNAPRR